MFINKMRDEDEVGAIFFFSILILGMFTIGGMIFGGMFVQGHINPLTPFMVSSVFVAYTLGLVVMTVGCLVECKYKWNATIPFFIYAVLFLVALGASNSSFPFVICLITTLILGEILFWVEKKNPKKGENVFEFTVKRKLENLFEGLIISGTIIGFISMNQVLVYGEILKGLITIGEGILVIAGVIIVLYGYFWINSKKYRNVKYQRRRKR